MPAAPVCDHLEEILKPFQQAYILLSLSWFMCVRIDVKITKNIFLSSIHLSKSRLKPI